MSYEFKRFRLRAVAHVGFETTTIYKKDFRTIDQVIKCAAGFLKETVSFSVEDRYLDRYLSLDDIVDQFREE